MKKLYTISTIMLSASLIQADMSYDEYKQFSLVAQPRRTEEQKKLYKQTKIQKNTKMETPEFRFALKLSEYYEKMLEQTMTPIEFIQEISRKISNYIKNSKDKTNDEIKDFLNPYLTLSLSELKAQVGTKKEEGIMNRYID